VSFFCVWQKLLSIALCPNKQSKEDYGCTTINITYPAGGAQLLKELGKVYGIDLVPFFQTIEAFLFVRELHRNRTGMNLQILIHFGGVVYYVNNLLNRTQ